MAKILLSTIVSNDLGPIMRMLPIAKRLRDSGHEIVFCNRAYAPAKLIQENGFKNIHVTTDRQPETWPAVFSAEIWNGAQGMAYEGFLDLEYVRSLVGAYINLLDRLDPDLVVDTWNQASCTAAKARQIPLVTINQADLHPQSKGLIWWKEPPGDLPDPIPVVNEVLSELNLPPVRNKVEELLIGDLVLVVGTPETDPLPPSANVTYIGSLQEIDREEDLPERLQSLRQGQSLIWVYPGNPRYGSNPSIADSIVILRAALTVFKDEEVQVVLSTGYQPLPEEFSELPPNFTLEQFVPGYAMARRADLLVHHGGHGSTLTGLRAGTPALIVPTYSERESNARRVVRLGAGEMVLPQTRSDGEKEIDLDEFRYKTKRLLMESSYREKAQWVANGMKQYAGPDLAVRLIEDFIKKRGARRL